MKRNNSVLTLVIFLAFVVGCLAYTFGVGNKPLLGLDLQGGVAVVLQPKNNPSTASVEQAKTIIRNRVDALGVAEPDIVRQGKTIVVQLPGVKDRGRALAVIGKTAKLEFRPTKQYLGPYGVIPKALTTTTTTRKVTTTTTKPSGSTTTTAPQIGTTAPPRTGTTAPVQSSSSKDSTQSLGRGPLAPTVGLNAAALPRQTTTSPSTTTPATTGATTATTAAPTTVAAAPPTVAPTTAAASSTAIPPSREALAKQLGVPVCSSDTKASDSCVTGWKDATGLNQAYLVGPLGAPGEAVASANAALGSSGGWVVNITIRDKYKTQVNTLFNGCYNNTAGCPPLSSSQQHGSVAVVLDGDLQGSPPEVNALNLADSGFQVSGNFTHKEASDLALVLRYGSLPVEFKKDVNVQEVSATLGKDSLHAGLVAGFVGLGLVALYMIIYYRLLGVVAVASLATGAALLWTVIAFLGETKGLALTLAGITGIIVSLGVAVDSNVVFYEHLREDMAGGRSPKAVVGHSFQTAWRTIVSADLVSLIGAFLLWWLTVGSVRGFAFYLGLATILDLVASWFFMRPVVFLLCRSDYFQTRTNLLGLRTRQSQAATEAAAAAEEVPA